MVEKKCPKMERIFFFLEKQNKTKNTDQRMIIYRFLNSKKKENTVHEYIRIEITSMQINTFIQQKSNNTLPNNHRRKSFKLNNK